MRAQAGRAIAQSAPGNVGEQSREIAISPSARRVAEPKKKPPRQSAAVPGNLDGSPGFGVGETVLREDDLDAAVLRLADTWRRWHPWIVHAATAYHHVAACHAELFERCRDRIRTS